MRTAQACPVRRHRTALTFAVAALGACAMGPLQVDTSARAPMLSGFGANTLVITTRSAEAQRLFSQGMAQAYAFNEVEAVRAFKAALAQDPACAMCAWGVAYQLGPNINATERGDLRDALAHVDLALRHLDGVSPRERALIEALGSRYDHRSQKATTAVMAAAVCTTRSGDKKPDPLDFAYAARMRELADRFKNDPDVVAIYAEAEMLATPGDDWWELATGRPVGRMGEVADRLELALKQQPAHVGLNHYMIHAVDALPVAARAEAAADRLAALAPNSPHLVHMPSHTFSWLGRYADASRVNQRALELDVALADELKTQGFSNSKDWRFHNGHFFWYAALMEGRGDAALDAARAAAARAKADHDFAELVRARPLLTLVRMARWEAVLQEPLPSGNQGMATVLGQYARGTASARSGQPAQVAAALALLEPAAAKVIAAHAESDNFEKLLRSVAVVARASLRAELALSEGRIDAALAHQAEAITAGRFLDDNEPPTLGAGARLMLGDMQLQARRWTEAEQTFRADLALHPRSGWALRGLAKSLEGQGRSAEAAAQRAALAREWRTADADLLRSL